MPADAAFGPEQRVVLQRYSESRAGLECPSLSSAGVRPETPERYPAATTVSHARARQLLYLDPPEHRRLRGAIVRALHQYDRNQLQARVSHAAREGLERAVGPGHVDLVSAVVRPAAAAGIAAVLGVSPDRCGRLLFWSRAIGITHEDPTGRAVSRARALTIAAEAIGTFGNWARRARSAGTGPDDDETGGLLAALCRDRRVTDETVAANLALVLFAGLETTANALSVVLARLCASSQLAAELREEPVAVPYAVTEWLRLDPPIQGVSRRATAPLSLGNRAIAAGQLVDILLSDANRDPRYFPDPRHVDLERSNGRGLTFGAGAHVCPGEGIARQIIHSATTAVLSAARDLTAVPPGPRWYPNGSIRGLIRLDAQITR